MKKETYAKKLAELLGLQEVHEELQKEKEVRKGNLQEVPESQIQTVREAQGITYFLQAPFLFQSLNCKHCGHPYLVSRLFVAYCSYTCIEKSLEEIGISWSRKGNIEAMVREVYEGQEPLWIRNIEQLKSALQKLISLTESPSPTAPTSRDAMSQ